MDFATVYCSNMDDVLVAYGVYELNEFGMINTNIWSVSAVLKTIKDYLSAYKHPHADELTAYILRAENSNDTKRIEDYVNFASWLMIGDKDSKQYWDNAYAKVLRANSSELKEMARVYRLQGSVELMFDGFFDRYFANDDARPTEFVEVMKTDTGLSKTLFLANDVDKFLEVAKVKNGDKFTLGRPGKNSYYLLLTVIKADGTKEVHPFIPVKWVRKAVSTNPFVKELIPADKVNSFYRWELQQ